MSELGLTEGAGIGATAQRMLIVQKNKE